MTPTTAATTIIATSWPHGMTSSVSPCFSRVARSAPARSTPVAPPRIVPYSAVSTDSTTISEASCVFPRPIARMSPISRVLSATESTRVLTMPRMAMTIDRPSRA